LIQSKPCFYRLSQWILLIALVFGAAAAPAPMLAQDAAQEAVPAQPAAVSVSGSPSKEAPKPEKKSEAEETQEYRHSPTVQWFARLLHVDVETAAKGFEYINFAVILLAVGIPLVKIVPKTLRKRSETLSQELATARTATADANTRLSAVEAKLAGLDAEITAIRKQVEEDMRGDEERIKASIGEESARIVAAAEQEIQVAAALAQRGLKQYAADLAIEGALSRLTLDAETDRALFAEFARDSKAVAGGQN
jgi:F-type H+-transporting ATPase subunit b